jgi:hypothetical protein
MTGKDWYLGKEKNNGQSPTLWSIDFLIQRLNIPADSSAKFMEEKNGPDFQSKCHLLDFERDSRTGGIHGKTLFIPTTFHNSGFWHYWKTRCGFIYNNQSFPLPSPPQNP